VIDYRKECEANQKKELLGQVFEEVAIKRVESNEAI